MHRGAAPVYVASVLSLLLVAGCGNPTRHKAIARRGLEQLHSRMDNGQYHEIYVTADPDLRQGVSEDELTSSLRSIHERLGSATSSSLTDYMAVGRLSGFTIFVKYDTKFSKGDGIESAAWRIRGDTPVLLQYEVTSPSFSGDVK